MLLDELLKEIKESEGQEKEEKSIYYINSLVVKLLDNNVNNMFWSFLFTYIPKEFKKDLQAPMAVTSKDNTITLLINSYHWDNYNTIEIEEILRHEGYHILMNHLAIYKDVFRNRGNAMLMNIATDCEINQYLTNLPKGCVTRETIAQITNLPLSDIPVKAGSLVYYDLLMENKPQNGNDGDQQSQGGGQGQGQGGQGQSIPDYQKIDSHELWSEIQEGISLSDQAKSLVNQARQDAEYHSGNGKSRGMLSGDLQALIEKLNQPGIVPWQRLIKSQMGRQIFGKKPSVNRFNRRLPYQLNKKGLLNDMRHPVLVAMDVSGSISLEDLSYFYNEVHKLSKSLRIPIELIQFDTEIKDSYIIKNKQQIKYSATGFGGTSFQAVFDYMKENKYTKDTMLFIFSDGYGESQIETHGYHKHHWVITEDGELSVSGNNRPVYKFKNQKKNK